MEADPGREQSANPQRRVCVACPRCGQGYRISARLLDRRLICRHCQNEWRAREVDPAAFRSGRLVGREPASDGAPGDSTQELPPAAGSSSVAIDMSWAGRELGRYKVLSLLGHGGMGSVWRAHDDALRRDVALKILNRAKQNGREAGGLNVQLFMQEARAVAKLKHPAVVSIYEVVEDNGQAFLALEMMEGGTLKDFVERYGAIPPREIFRMMMGPTRALAVAHKHGIVHRDIKPTNLMLDEHGNLKLMDFGLADVAYEEASERMRGKAVGSLGWIAPETARGLGTTASSDIYGMGLVLLYALTGKPWLQSKSRSELIAIHQNPPKLDLSAIKGLTPKAEAMLRKCLAVDQQGRFATAEHLAEALKECAEENPEAKAKQTKLFASIAIAAALFGCVITFATAVYYFTGLSDREKTYRAPLQPPGDERIVPLQYQKRQSPQKPADGSPTTAPSGAAPSSGPAGVIPPAGPVIDPARTQFIGSRDDAYFHNPDSECGRNIAASDVMMFKSYVEAATANRKPCPKCDPLSIATTQPQAPAP